MRVRTLLKASIVVLAIAALHVAGTARAGIIYDDDMSSLDLWGEGSNDPNEEGDLTGGIQVVDLDANPGPDAVQFNSWWGDDGAGSTAGWTQMWANSEVIVENEKEYTLTVSMVSYNNGADVPIALQNVTEGWTDIVTSSPQAIATDVFTDYSISFSTVGGANAGAIGDAIGIVITPNWWNNGAVDNVSISVIPEPVSLLLALVGGVLLVPARRR